VSSGEERGRDLGDLDPVYQLTVVVRGDVRTAAWIRMVEGLGIGGLNPNVIRDWKQIQDARKRFQDRRREQVFVFRRQRGGEANNHGDSPQAIAMPIKRPVYGWLSTVAESLVIRHAAFHNRQHFWVGSAYSGSGRLIGRTKLKRTGRPFFSAGL